MPSSMPTSPRRSARLRAKTPKKSSSRASQLPLEEEFAPTPLARNLSWQESREDATLFRERRLIKKWETFVVRLVDHGSSHNVERALMDYKARIEAGTWKSLCRTVAWWGLVVLMALTVFFEFHWDTPARISWRFSNDSSVLIQVGDWGLDVVWWQMVADKAPFWLKMLATSIAPLIALNYNRCLVFLLGKTAKEYLQVDDDYVLSKMQQVRINISLNSLVESPNEPAELRMRTLDEKAWSAVFTQDQHAFLFNELLYGYSGGVGIRTTTSNDPPSHANCVECNVGLNDLNRADTEHEACIHGSLCLEHEDSRNCGQCRVECTIETLTKRASPFLSLGRIPSLKSDMIMVAKTVRDHFVNLLSKTSAPGFLAHDFGRSSDSQQYAYGVTFEDQDDGKNRKIRILLMRTDKLDRLHELSRITKEKIVNAWQSEARTHTRDLKVGFKHDQNAAGVLENMHYHAYCRDRCEQLLKLRRILKAKAEKQEYRRCLPLKELTGLLQTQKKLSLCGYVYLSVA